MHQALLHQVRPPPPKQLSLSERLSRYLDEDGEVGFRLLDEIEADDEAAKSFRYHGASSQYKQDKALAVYYDYIRLLCRKSGVTDSTQAEIEQVAFPSKEQDLFKLARGFINLVFKTARPRSGNPSERIDWKTLTHYRDAFIFWCRRKYNEYWEAAAPKDQENLLQFTNSMRIRLFNSLTTAMQYVQRQYKGTPKDYSQKTTMVGLPELQQLLDYEITNNRYIEVSEQHQVIWCILRQTAVRPGSIGITQYRKEPLLWKDVQITTGESPGQFTAVITLKNLKAQAEDVATDMNNSRAHTLECELTSPNIENIHFSVPHRLLVILLRRNLLLDYTDLGSLLKSDKVNILIKPEHLNDPVFFRALPRGLGLDPPHPLSRGAISDYLADRGFAIGYENRITAYSLRRKTATDLVARVGYELTREILGHTPESRTLERYYVNIRRGLQLTSTTLNQGHEHSGISAIALDNFAPLALGKLDQDTVSKIKGAALNALTNKLMAEDESFPVAATKDEFKQYKKRVRKRAAAALLQNGHLLRMQSVSRKEQSDREFLLEASNFAESVINYALDLIKTPSSMANIIVDAMELTEEETAILEQEQDLPDIEQDDEPERDVEESEDHSAQVQRLRVDATIDEAFQSSSANVPYLILAKSFMEILMHNKLQEEEKVEWKVRDQTCPLCQQDETVSQQQKEKAWSSHVHLERHMLGEFHSRRRQWIRRQVNKSVNGALPCPYCEASGRSDISRAKKVLVFTEVEELLRHINSSTVAKDGELHENLKEVDGWLEADFAGPAAVSRYTQANRDAETKRKLKALNVDLTDRPTSMLESMPDPKRARVWRGAIGRHSFENVPNKFAKTVVMGDVVVPSLATEDITPNRKALIAGNLATPAQLFQTTRNLPAYAATGCHEELDPRK